MIYWGGGEGDSAPVYLQTAGYEEDDRGCALCKEYYTVEGVGFLCSRCPVRIKTGFFGCKSTPWENVPNSYQIRTDEVTIEHVVACHDELMFLCSLEEV